MKLVPTWFRCLLFAQVALALAVRLVGLNFDQSHYLHPDERRIAKAVTQLSLRPPAAEQRPALAVPQGPAREHTP